MQFVSAELDRATNSGGAEKHAIDWRGVLRVFDAHNAFFDDVGRDRRGFRDIDEIDQPPSITRTYTDIRGDHVCPAAGKHGQIRQQLEGVVAKQPGQDRLHGSVPAVDHQNSDFAPGKVAEDFRDITDAFDYHMMKIGAARRRSSRAVLVPVASGVGDDADLDHGYSGLAIQERRSPSRLQVRPACMICSP